MMSRPRDFLTVTEPGGEPRLAATRENGQVQLTLTGKQGSRYAIETSTALTNWTSAALTVTGHEPERRGDLPRTGRGQRRNASIGRCGSKRVVFLLIRDNPVHEYEKSNSSLVSF
jgi:hypothetical protein